VPDVVVEPASPPDESPSPHRSRRRLSRTFSRSRLGEYRSLLQTAIGHGYDAISVERFLDDPAARSRRRVLILRHDVDQHPGSAVGMAEIERELGVRSTWYLRWRTADPGVVSALRQRGGEIGFHYETLTRRVLAEGLGPDRDLSELLLQCRQELAIEIAAFDELCGPIRSVSAHGDSRVPWVRNLTLVDNTVDPDLGVYDANLAMRRHHLGCWLTDRSAAEGGWGDAQRPAELLREGVSPIQCLVHPNNWTSGASLWRDRILGTLLAAPEPATQTRITRTRPDTPGRSSDDYSRR
jgi:hypothetical protein